MRSVEPLRESGLFQNRYSKADSLIKDLHRTSSPLSLLYPAFPTYSFPSPQNTPTQKESRSEDESKIIPEPAVMHLVETDRLGENRNDKRNGCNQAMPNPSPESSDLTLVIRHFLQLIRTCHAARQYKNKNEAYPKSTYHLAQS
jgi:hypothetical protein